MMFDGKLLGRVGATPKEMKSQQVDDSPISLSTKAPMFHHGSECPICFKWVAHLECPTCKWSREVCGGVTLNIIYVHLCRA